MANQDVRISIKAVDKTKAGFSGVTSGLKRLSGAVFNVKTALLGVVGSAGFGALVKSSINAGDELAKTADKLGVTTTALAGLRHAAELTGVSTQTMDMAMQRFTRRAAEAARGTGEAKGALRELGINAEDLVKLPLDQQMSVVADSMAGVERQSDKVRLAMKLFDSEGVALVNTLGDGSTALEQMTGEAEALGLALDRTAAAEMEMANDSLTRLKGVFVGITTQISSAFSPLITVIADKFRQAALDSNDFGNTAQNAATAIINAFGKVVNALHGVRLAFVTTKSMGLEVLLFFREVQAAIAEVLDRSNVNELQRQLQHIETMRQQGNFTIAQARRLQDQLTQSYREGNLVASDNEFAESVEQTKQALAGANQEMSQLMANPNPGDEMVAGFNELVIANRKTAESIGRTKDAMANTTPVVASGLEQMGDAISRFEETLPSLQQNLDTLTKSTFKGMSDGLMSIVKGTASVGDAFKKMAAQLIMQAIQLFVIDKITGGFLSFVKGLTGKAIGGPVQAGQPYMVGERGPEMFVPNQSGSIVPNDKMGGGGITVVNNVDASGAGSDVDLKIRAAMQQSSQQTIASIQDLMRRRRFV